MQISDARLEQHGSKNLEIGFVFFFDQFRRIYIGEQVNRPSNVRGQCFSESYSLKYFDNQPFFSENMI